MSVLMQILPIFASAGGGGSGGGSGGGGGGIFGGYYIAGYFFASSLKRKLPVPVAIALSGVLMFILALIFVSDLFIWVLLLLASGLGIHNGIVGLIGKFKKLSKKASQDLSVARIGNQAEWSEPAIMDRVRDVFMRFQQDWSNGSVELMKEYLLPKYHTHVALMIAAMNQMNRANKMSEVKISDAFITKVTDVAGEEQDEVDVTFGVHAIDQLVEDGKPLYTRNGEFIETWHFEQEDGKWMLEGITPSTAIDAAGVQTMRDFAQKNNMFYSLNWGQLLLPKRGQLFSRANFTQGTRVDNHIIGMWDSLLVQLYVYTSTESSFWKTLVSRTVGQITLPKSYGGIIVNDKRSMRSSIFGSRSPKGYTRYTLEWGEFNQRYDLFATDADKLASFELLNPAFMAWLYDHAEHISIEVVDNVVYIHCVSPAAGKYEVMLEVLRRSYDELKR